MTLSKSVVGQSGEDAVPLSELADSDKKGSTDYFSGKITTKYDSLSAKVRDYRAAYHKSISSPQKTEKSSKEKLYRAEPPKIEISDMAQAFYELGLITPDKSERLLMIRFLKDLKKESAPEYIRSIDSLIHKLESDLE